ncbi:transposable element Tc1 transposase [Trichonephila clavipes]|nr:transposable element Tc1 transposase [Trichonephila clavipes]
MLNSCVMLRHTGPSPGIMVWGVIGYHSRTPLVRIAGTLNSQRYISEMLEPIVLPHRLGLATAIFHHDNARPDVARIVQRSITRLNCFPGRLGIRIFSDRKHVVHGCSTIHQDYTPSCNKRYQVWKRVDAAWSAVPQDNIQSLFESMPKNVAAVISCNGGYSGY